MKKLIMISLFMLFFVNTFYSQGENNNWYFGNKAALNFATSTPTVLSNSNMNQLESVASISDASGNLLFYTNGVNVWNRQHQIMTNGSGLLGNDTTEQILILPHPGNSNLYYLFTMSHVFASPCNIVYSLIDMSQGTIGLNGNPLGVVSGSIKNIPLHDENGMLYSISTEAITCTPNNDNSAYWILIPNGTKLYSYLLDNTGFIDNPATSSLLFPSQLNEYSQIKVSPNLPLDLSLPYTNLVSITLWNNVTQTNDIRINSFDNNTGLLSALYNARISSLNAYSTEFSEDGRLLYAGVKNAGIFIFDLFNTDSSSNARVVTNLALDYGSIQRGINNEMYVSCNGNDYISRIQNSNSFSLSSFILNDINLNIVRPSTKFCTLGLPQLIPPISQHTCMPNRVLSGLELNNTFDYRASNTITTNNNYLVSAGQNINLKAGNWVLLGPNTAINAQSTFIAKVETCFPISQKKGYVNVNTINNTFNIDSSKINLLIYPNPVKNGVFYINTDANAERTVSVFNVLGKQVLNTTTSENAINVSSLTAGVYMVQITEEGKTATRKLVIE